MPFITTRASGVAPEDDIEDGVHRVYLVDLQDPRMIVTQRNPEGVDVYTWVFALANDDSDRTIETISNEKSSGPRSKTWSIIAALLGRQPREDEPFEKADLIGKPALATVIHNDAGYPRIQQLTAVPREPAARTNGATQTNDAGQVTATRPVEPVVVAAVSQPAQAADPAEDELGF